VDFSYEVSRSLAACQGALLLVDTSQGIQAQTVANFWLAFSAGLTILPVLNKIDLPGADVAGTALQLQKTFELPPQPMIAISAKSGLNVDMILSHLVSSLPSPLQLPPSLFVGSQNSEQLQSHQIAKVPLKALLFDTVYDLYRGVICYFAVLDGKISKGRVQIFLSIEENA
jgi:translation factor GUF1, mitochondrial